MDKRGPKIGDAASLWNFTPSPGWTKEESLILKLCLMKYGVGQWIQIQATGLLPGKLIQQLNGATQRLLGQQSLAAFSGLRVDVDRVRADNEAKVDAHRKNGLVIWSGPNPTRQMRQQWQQEVKEKYSLTPEQQREAEAALEELAAAMQATLPPAAAAATAAAVETLPAEINILECDADQLTTQQKQLLLCALHQHLQQLVCKAVQQQPSLASLLTYQQQPQQGWISQGAAAAASGAIAGAASGAAAGSVSISGAAGADSDASDFKENQPHRANLLVRQAGTAAGRLSKASSSKGGSKGGSKAANSGSKAGGGKDSSSKPAKKKRPRSKPTADMDDADDEDAFLQKRQQQRKRGGGRGSKGSSGGGSGLLAEMMKAAMESGVAQLVDMGYSRSKALDALKECNCDVELAVEYLTTACC